MISSGIRKTFRISKSWKLRFSAWRCDSNCTRSEEIQATLFDTDAPHACYAVLWTVALGRKHYVDNGGYDLEMSNVDTLFEINVQVWLDIQDRKYKKFTRLT
ncbi:hypothetical protein MPTK1_6g14070 [Marchantia polymorpha subsp. ruderalis]|uniref:Uncharacterized protein n=2 Tax=Marchantia polymorpha TaxID=3197 RepID=A0AAF6BRV2_MARPO|nr:hypothetical protein MARPO_0865s0001 [Marchantia polymorpha]BBN14736.1 hypothetical protein Mp_6g14070 [Marchantia polymorpha subsp. ruderalis]|eukprot:PTQ26608.1 hypothetical protein MARPO_0865s0001 [Marchantia polymorpha]